MRHLTLQALSALTLTAATAVPLMAETVEECSNRVTRECDAALAESNWIEKVAVGIVCSGMYLACGGVAVTIKVL